MAVRLNNFGDSFLRTATVPATTTLTVAGWFYQVNTVGGGGNDLFALTANGSFSHECAVYYDAGTSNLSFYEGSGGGTPSVASYTTGQWVYVALVLNGTGAGSCKVYSVADGGVLAEELSTSRSLAYTITRVEFGTFTRYSEWFDGRMESLKIWTAPLTLVELQAEMNSLAAVRTADLWAEIKCDVATGADTSGNSRNFTPTGVDLETGRTYGSGASRDASFIASASSLYQATSTKGSVSRSVSLLSGSSATFSPAASSVQLSRSAAFVAGSSTFFGGSAVSGPNLSASGAFISSSAVIYEPTASIYVPTTTTVGAVHLPSGSSIFSATATRRRPYQFPRNTTMKTVNIPGTNNVSKVACALSSDGKYVVMTGGNDETDADSTAAVMIGAIAEDNSVTWSLATPMPVARANHSMLISGDWVIVLGGATYVASVGTGLETGCIGRLVAGKIISWEMFSIPATASPGLLFESRGFLYYTSGLLANLYKAPYYNGRITGPWQQIGRLQAPSISANSSYCVAGDHLYIAGDNRDLQRAQINDSFTTASWSSVRILNGYSYCGLGLDANGRLVMAGGFNDVDTSQAEILVADLRAGDPSNFRQAGSLLLGRDSPQVSIAGGRILAFGGLDDAAAPMFNMDIGKFNALGNIE